MQLIAHRINTVKELKSLPSFVGVEIDVRDEGKDLILQHDAFMGGERLDEFLGAYRHKTLILNIKSSHVEQRAQEALIRFGITDYFFLDCSMPMIHTLTEAGERNVAVRFSEFEGLETIQELRNRCSWVWVDSFNRFTMTVEQFEKVREWGYRVCLVSPELQGRPEEVPSFVKRLKQMGIQPEAVCTKRKFFSVWTQLSGQSTSSAA